MGLNQFFEVVLLCYLFSLLCLRASSDSSGVSVKFLKTPNAFSNLNSTTFVFEAIVGEKGLTCTNCSLSCKLDHHITADCETREVLLTALQDGNHTFQVCANVSRGVGCARHNWIIDTVPPTAIVTALESFTNALNISVNVSFSEPCTGGEGFGCSSVNACKLLVYGAGQVIPSSLNVLLPNFKYSLLVAISPSVQYGRVILVMDKNFCTDNAGNKFMRAENSVFFVHFDRRSVFLNVRPQVPERLLRLNGETRTVLATNSYNNLKVFLYFSKPVRNSSKEIVNALTTSQGMLLPTSGDTHGKRRFEFLVTNISNSAIITINIDSSSVISRQWTPVSSVSPVTFLYDTQRPTVRLSTTANMRTRDHHIPISIKFVKPVFGFNSSYISISGGHFLSFHELTRSIYTIEIHADNDVVSVSIPENVTGDVAGNKNLASNILKVRHYSVPTISFMISSFATATFLLTSVVAGLLTISTSSLLSVGAFSRPSFSLTSDPARSLFRIACYIQMFALSRWLAVTLPLEYYEFARGLQWIIPYFGTPWETRYAPLLMMASSPSASLYSYMSTVHDISEAASVYGSPLTSMEYQLFFESQNMKPEAEYIKDPQDSNGWRDFKRTMFWLAVTGGGLILLHVLLILVLKFKKENPEKRQNYGALTFPRLEIFLIILALPCICKASTAIIRGGSSLGVIVGTLLLGIASLLLLALLLFLSIGISLGKLLQYKEVHREGENFRWYQEMVRVTLGPGKRGQWAWKNQPNSDYLIIFGPLFEDLRGPPKYMLTQIAGGNLSKPNDDIIGTDDETEDAEAPFIQKLFGILRIYYTLLESVKRVSLGIVAGAYDKKFSSKTPIIMLLCITSFQLFSLVLKKPFIKKKVQMVEIISVSCEVGIFASCFILLKSFSAIGETEVGIFMLILFLVGYFALLINEWYALYRQTKRLDPDEKSLLLAIKIALIGILLLFIPNKWTKNLESRFPKNQPIDGGTGDTDSPAERYRNLGTNDKPSLKQLREIAKASFSKEGSGRPSDPSSSHTRWSGFWVKKRSGSSSQNSGSDPKSKPRKLYKDLEAIFASK